MNIKKGDKIKIIKGKDRGKTGKVLQIFSVQNKASIEGLNLLIKHLRPRKQGEKGQKIEFPAAISLSNVMLVCPKCGKAVRVSHKIIKIGDKEKKVRECKKCRQLID